MEEKNFAEIVAEIEESMQEYEEYYLPKSTISDIQKRILEKRYNVEEIYITDVLSENIANYGDSDIKLNYTDRWHYSFTPYDNSYVIPSTEEIIESERKLSKRENPKYSRKDLGF